MLKYVQKLSFISYVDKKDRVIILKLSVVNVQFLFYLFHFYGPLYGDTCLSVT